MMSERRGWGEIPGWLGNVPFPPDRKRPCLLGEDGAKVIFYGFGKEKISVTIYCSTDKVLFSEWEVPPGQSFQPADIHSGDETYYVLSGELTEADPTTGQVLLVKEGDFIHIPAKTWHNAYNFSGRRLHIINPAEGGMWVEEDLDKVAGSRFKTVRYKGQNAETIRDIIAGSWPEQSSDVQGKFRMRHIPPERALSVIHGVKNESRFTFFVSNERLHVGTFVICPGKFTDPEVHRGDEALMVLEGSLELSVSGGFEAEGAVMKDGCRVGEGQKFFVPEGTWHQYFNLSSQMCRVLFIVAPGL